MFADFPAFVEGSRFRLINLLKETRQQQLLCLSCVTLKPAQRPLSCEFQCDKGTTCLRTYVAVSDVVEDLIGEIGLLGITYIGCLWKLRI